jgi:ketosteroid isomerase-like protein
MSESQVLSPRGVVEAAHRAIFAGDVDGFVLCFAEDAVLEFPFSAEPSLPSRVEGRDAIRRVAPALRRRVRHTGIAPGLGRGPIVRETTDAEGIVLELDTPVDTPERTTLPDIQVWRVRDGQVLSMRHYLGARTAGTAAPADGRASLGSAWG